MKRTEIGCIGCGMRCTVELEHDEDTVHAWTGNNCARGEAYAIDMLGLPKRIIKPYLKVSGGRVAAVFARSLDPVAIEDHKELMDFIQTHPLEAPLSRHEHVTLHGVRFEILEDVKSR